MNPVENEINNKKKYTKVDDSNGLTIYDSIMKMIVIVISFYLHALRFALMFAIKFNFLYSEEWFCF